MFPQSAVSLTEWCSFLACMCQQLLLLPPRAPATAAAACSLQLPLQQQPWVEHVGSNVPEQLRGFLQVLQVCHTLLLWQLVVESQGLLLVVPGASMAAQEGEKQVLLCRYCLGKGSTAIVPICRLLWSKCKQTQPLPLAVWSLPQLPRTNPQHLCERSSSQIIHALPGTCQILALLAGWLLQPLTLL